MRLSTTETLPRLVGALLLALVATFGLSACGDDAVDGEVPGVEDVLPTDEPAEEPTEDAPEEPAYDGAYDNTFRQGIDDHVDKTVALTGEVEKVISDNAFTLAGNGGTEALLVVGADPTTGLEPGAEVTVTGVVHKAFDLPAVEDEIDVDFDDDTVFQGFDRDPYIQATTVETSTGGATP